ncbi:hypothetical protein TNCT_94561 [Trichonephila clavata]|uniref:Uncharacterized protein n=1 Tax=Trichonephila clavata TaxID=2740835 RepID=A0A8X6G1V9_TRICU|nr:hypothetical protein TNCT_94561 [Trichonephila clavata]
MWHRPGSDQQDRRWQRNRAQQMALAGKERFFDDGVLVCTQKTEKQKWFSLSSSLISLDDGRNKNSLCVFAASGLTQDYPISECFFMPDESGSPVWIGSYLVGTKDWWNERGKEEWLSGACRQNSSGEKLIMKLR